MDAYKAPENDTTHAAEDDDAPPPVVSWVTLIAGATLAVAGLFTAGAGAQLEVFFRLYDWIQAVPYVFGLLGCAAMLFGSLLTQGRDWAAFASTVVAVMCVVFGLAWNAYALYVGLVSVLSLISFLLCVLAALLVPLSIPNALAVSAAKRQLYA